MRFLANWFTALPAEKASPKASDGASDGASDSASPDASESSQPSTGSSPSAEPSSSPSGFLEPDPSEPTLPGLEPIVENAPSTLRPWLAFGIPIVAALIITWLVWFILARLLRKRPRVKEQLGRLQIPVFCLLLSVGLMFGTPGVIEDEGFAVALAVILKVAAVASITWLAVTVLSVVEVSVIVHYEESGDPRQVAKLRTQMTLMRRLVTAIVLVLGVGAVLLMIPSVRAMGATVLASAGLISVVAGLAVQGVLTNVFAGLQLAFSDAIRVEDIVVVEGQRGNVKEITLTYVVVKLVDGRNVILPSTYFTTTPFENWSRGGEEINGSVTLDLRWDAPVAALRKRVDQLLDATDLWDGRYSETVVTNAAGGNMELTVMLSARNPGDLWDLKNYIRENLVHEVMTKYPESLPKVVGGGNAA
ncbi:mechanosensitive ion channel family protein [Pseudoglutamicibacter cumminsii]|uniref:Mechanosensitive ion channel family protein n=1 Tax=Pseudoglutamicibacter cumminsii TaxID=156979 RepID=A0AAP4CAI8_9MICC|nr:mechanosensitive ion channel family protein [Pseudoglutamicibacter cumminsii]MCT1686694.1 mechanosensitive ion channel family protein [Pseudoglutamicibacter cumminsii]MDK6274776.1 mechanosensitive ion channel family protein [Pseudoglutamicibacter cumminsii]MDZ3744948.1 mechanosensitive ion channel family protein [Pseudoglutamicibacter cumminsii]